MLFSDDRLPDHHHILLLLLLRCAYRQYFAPGVIVPLIIHKL